MDPVRAHVVALLRGGQAFDDFEQVVGAFEPAERGVAPPGAERSAWQILEHMRIALRDILDYTQNENGAYREIEWPNGYWPPEPAPGPGGWEATLEGYRNDIAEMERLVSDVDRDLFRPFPWGDGQTLLREALLAADHAAYHIGQLVMLRRWIEHSRTV